jgi:hypothetical protein
MPEQSGHQKPSAWTLSKAHDSGQLVRVGCVHCSVKRWYAPADLQWLLGDIPADAIRMRCERCKKTEWIRASFERPSAAERQAIKLRRLAEVRTVRKVVWRDER